MKLIHVVGFLTTIVSDDVFSKINECPSCWLSQEYLCERSKDVLVFKGTKKGVIRLKAPYVHGATIVARK